MVEIQLEKQGVERTTVESLGEDWIRAIQDGALDRLAQFCSPRVTSRLLLPGGLVSLNTATDLVARYRDWFDGYTAIRVEASRVSRVGSKLGIFYRLLLQDGGVSERIEQQLYCILKDGHVQQLHLVCSGFHPVEARDQAGTAKPAAEAPQTGEQDPVRDALLEFYPEASDTASTCALLTPIIKSKLGEMRSAQVLEVRVNDPAAQGDVEAWSRLSGNALLKMVHEGQTLRFFVQKK
jgi:TusA-related sulfurtransferase